MSVFPLRFEVGVHAYSLGPSDGYASTVVYTPPWESPGIAEKVHGWSSPTNTETATEVHNNIVVTDVELLAPAGFSVNPYDLIDLPDGQYEVVGRPQDMSYGPFGTDFGVVVKLRRWEA